MRITSIVAAAALLIGGALSTAHADSEDGYALSRCGGIAGFQCPDANQYCDMSGQCGTADGMGTCMTRPQFCTQQFDPVCGCDGETYGNACMAAGKGVSIAYKGECRPSP